MEQNNPQPDLTGFPVKMNNYKYCSSVSIDVDGIRIVVPYCWLGSDDHVCCYLER